MNTFLTDTDKMKTTCSGCGWGNIEEEDATDVVVIMVEENGSSGDEICSKPQTVNRVNCVFCTVTIILIFFSLYKY